MQGHSGNCSARRAWQSCITAKSRHASSGVSWLRSAEMWTAVPTCLTLTLRTPSGKGIKRYLSLSLSLEPGTQHSARPGAAKVWSACCRPHSLLEGPGRHRVVVMMRQAGRVHAIGAAAGPRATSRLLSCKVLQRHAVLPVSPYPDHMGRPWQPHGRVCP